MVVIRQSRRRWEDAYDIPSIFPLARFTRPHSTEQNRSERKGDVAENRNRTQYGGAEPVSIAGHIYRRAVGLVWCSYLAKS